MPQKIRDTKTAPVKAYLMLGLPFKQPGFYPEFLITAFTSAEVEWRGFNG